MRVPIFQWRLRRTRIVAVALAVVAAPLVAASAVAPHAAAATACPWVNSTAPISTRVSELMAQMSLSQEIDLMTAHPARATSGTSRRSAHCASPP